MAKVETKILNVVENTVPNVENYWEEGIWLKLMMSKH